MNQIELFNPLLRMIIDISFMKLYSYVQTVSIK